MALIDIEMTVIKCHSSSVYFINKKKKPHKNKTLKKTTTKQPIKEQKNYTNNMPIISDTIALKKNEIVILQIIVIISINSFVLYVQPSYVVHHYLSFYLFCFLS